MTIDKIQLPQVKESKKFAKTSLLCVPFLEVDVNPVDIDVNESVKVANSLSDQ